MLTHGRRDARFRLWWQNSDFSAVSARSREQALELTLSCCTDSINGLCGDAEEVSCPRLGQTSTKGRAGRLKRIWADRSRCWRTRRVSWGLNSRHTYNPKPPKPTF